MEYRSCSTPYCDTITEGKCIVCGGIFSECRCGEESLDACICGGQVLDIRDIKTKYVYKLLKNIWKQLYFAVRYNDWWWFKQSFNIGKW